MTTSEVEPTIERTFRIHDALSNVGVNSETICTTGEKPLAVLVKDWLNPGEVLGSLPLHRAMEEGEWDLIWELKDTLPISGEHVFPKRFLEFMDVVSQAAAHESNGLATRLRSATIRDDMRVSMKTRDLGIHADFVGSSSYVEKGLKLHGLNVHYTRWGSAVVRLGLLGSLSSDSELVALQNDQQNGKITQAEHDQAVENLATSFAEPFELRAGDILVFQAQQHTEKALVPVLHDFVTTSASRRSDTFKPELGDAESVQQRRASITEKFSLGSLGY